MRQAKRRGNLIVVIARDKTAKEVKGKLPRHDEKQRLKAVLGLNLADRAVLGSLKDKYAAIRKYRPGIIALGYDQKYFTDQLTAELKKLKLKTKIIRLKPYKPEEYKTSIINNSNFN